MLRLKIQVYARHGLVGCFSIEALSIYWWQFFECQ